MWAGCSQPPEALGDLAEKLAAALAGGGFLEPAMQPRFTPHVTLLRKLAQSAPPLPACVPLHWPCTSFVLVRSLLAADGPSYRTLAEFPLDNGLPAGVRPAESGW
jgi:2'-5' RNA ligase